MAKGEISGAQANGSSPKPSVSGLEAVSHGNSTISGIPKFDTFQSQRKWQLEHLAAAFRHFSRAGYVEGISGHISVRDPENENMFWMNPLCVSWAIIKASDMVLVDIKGQIVGGNSRPVDTAGFLIHSAIYSSRPDVRAVAHAHSVYGKAWSVFCRPLDMLNQDVCDIYNAQGVYSEYGGIVFTKDEGVRIAAALGNGKGCILLNHGLITVGQTVDEAAYLFGLMERSCQVQLLVESCPLPKKIIPDDQAAYNHKMTSKPDLLYQEFQPYYQHEEYASEDDFKD